MKSEVGKFIDSVNWQFAKTMPEIPHEYIVADHYPSETEQIKKLIEEIQRNGYTKLFYGKKYKYLEIDGNRYWVIGNIINREKINL